MFMRIAFDGKRAVFNNTGLGNYSRLIIDALSEYYSDNDYLLYAPKMKHNDRLTPIIAKSCVHTVSPHGAFNKTFSSLWRVSNITSALKDDKVQLFHGLSNELPLNIASSGIPSIVTIHDLIFLRYPEYYKPIDRKIYNYKFRHACENATRIIAISECTKSDIINYYDIPPTKIDVVYQGCDKSFNCQWSTEQLKDVKRRFNLPDKYILNVGTIESRKNALLIVRSLVNLPNDIHLVIVGRATPYINKINSFIEENALSDRVHFYHQLPFSDLPAFYRLASVFAYPSRFEGFGIPILEALASGTPAIGATGSCLEEAGGDDAIYVNPDSEQEMTHAILTIFDNNEKRAKMIENGLIHASRFNKHSIADNTMAIYNKILNLK